MDSIVACAVFQDTAPHILEWLAFHRMIGVGRFVLYGQGNIDNTVVQVSRSRFARQTVMIALPGTAGRAAAYADFAANHAARCTWVALIDPGDFLHPLAADSLHALLPRYDRYSSVAVRRLSFVVSLPDRTGQLLTGTHTNRLTGGPSQAGTATALLRTRDLLGLRDDPPAFTMAGEPCDAADDVLVVNSYRPVDGRPETVADRRMLRFVPRLRALLHDVPPVPAPPSQPAAARPPQAPSPLLTLGIGVITYNRCAVLGETLDRIQQHTRYPQTVLAVADDGSTDGTLDMLRDRKVPTVTGPNMSIAWNKNRALFLLAGLLRCDVIVLLEDDAYPTRDNWEAEWMQAALRWGHVNIADELLRKSFISGSGLLDDPILCKDLTAQCAAFSREAILFGGYFDTRFRGYGHEHVEHTYRLARLGYGATDPNRPGGMAFKMIWGGIGRHPVQSQIANKHAQARLNEVLARKLLQDVSYRAPWQNEDEARQLRDEMRRSLPRKLL